MKFKCLSLLLCMSLAFYASAMLKKSQDQSGSALLHFFLRRDGVGDQLRDIHQKVAQAPIGLDLSQVGLDDLPEELKMFTNVFSLRLYQNDLSLNSFDKLCRWFSKLKALDISYTRLTALPASFADLQSLEHLDASLNSFSLRDLETIFRIRSLRCLLLGENNLKVIPPSIAQLVNLSRLNLRNNHLDRAALQSISQLPNLKRLNISGNELVELPDSMCAMNSLERLNLSKNSLSPKAVFNICYWFAELKRLNLAGNRLSELPTALKNLMLLGRLNIKGNPVALEVWRRIKDQLNRTEIISDFH